MYMVFVFAPLAKTLNTMNELIIDVVPNEIEFCAYFVETVKEDFEIDSFHEILEILWLSYTVFVHTLSSISDFDPFHNVDIYERKENTVINWH